MLQDFYFPTYETKFVLFLAVLEISVLLIGWVGHLTLHDKSDVRTINFRSDLKNMKWHLEKVVMQGKMS